MAEKIVPAVKISDEYKLFLPYRRHCRVHIAAGGADAATRMVSLTSLEIERKDNPTDNITGSIINLIKHTRYTPPFFSISRISVSAILTPETIMARGVFS